MKDPLAKSFSIIFALIIFVAAGFILLGSYEMLTDPDIDWLSVLKADIAIFIFLYGIFLVFLGLKSAHGILKDFYGQPESVKEQ